MEHIIKRKGHKEPFDERKIYASVFAACMSLQMRDEEAETISAMVTEEIKEAVKQHHEIAATTLYHHVVKSLHTYHPDAAYMYQQHKDLS